MKQFAAIALLVLGTNTISMGQENKKIKESVTSKQSEIINVSANDLWTIIGPGFGEAHIWSSSIDHIQATGKPEFEGATCSARSCELNASGFSKINEKLVDYNETNMELEYEIVEGSPGFVTKLSNRWKVIEVGPNQSRLQMTISMNTKKFMGTLMGGMLNRNINKLIPTIFEDLKVYAETGGLSERKKKRVAKLAA